MTAISRRRCDGVMIAGSSGIAGSFTDVPTTRLRLATSGCLVNSIRHSSTIYIPRESSKWQRVPKATGLLNIGGLLNEKSESFERIFRPPRATMMVAFDPQFFVPETESAAEIHRSALTLCYQQDTKTPSHSHDWALSVN